MKVNDMSKTRTGGFPIGFRRGWTDWQKDITALAGWAKANAFACLDVGGGFDNVKAVRDAGLAVGSVDLLNFKQLITADESARGEAVDANLDLIRRCADVDQKVFFTVMLPADPSAKRRDNFDLMLAGYEPLIKLCDEVGGHIVIEGYPGAGALCCSPDTLDPLFEKFDTPAIGINYDPSHLIRLGVDPMRFLRDYVKKVHHVHAKDTEMLPERQYRVGTEQPPVFAEGIGFGGGHWRYTLPGHGIMRWVAAFEILKDADYAGYVSIELEDANFNGSEAGEKQGLIVSRDYLASC